MRGHWGLETRYAKEIAESKGVTRREFFRLFSNAGLAALSFAYAERSRAGIGALNGLGAFPGRGYLSGSSAPSQGFYASGHYVTARQALMLNYPRPDAETATWARHHYAYYDGTNAIEYDVPIICGFGAFPFVYQIMPGTPSWLSLGWSYWPAWGSGNNWLPGLDAHTNGFGRIKGTPTGTVSGATVWVRVWDQGLNYIDVKWTLSTASTWNSTNQYGFLFADSSGGVNSNSGSFDSRLADLTGLFGSTLAASTYPGALAYLATGTGDYEPPQMTDGLFGNGMQFDTTKKPSALMTLPGDSPVIDASLYLHCFVTNTNASDLFLKDLSFNGYDSSAGNFKLIYLNGKDSTAYRQTFDGITWTNPGYGSTGTDNSCAIHSPQGAAGSYAQYISMTGYSETGRQSGSPGNNFCGWDLYCLTNVVGQYSSAINATGGCDAGFFMKSDIQNGCMQGNYASFSSCLYPFSFLQSIQGNLFNSESRFNLGINCQEIYAPGTNSSGSLWAYRNTLLTLGSGVGLTAFGGGGYLCWFGSNAIQSTHTPIPNGGSTNIQTDGNNLVGGSILNADGTLASTESAHLGLVGPQIQ